MLLQLCSITSSGIGQVCMLKFWLPCGDGPHALLWCRSAECYVQLLNLLNIDYPPEAGTQLCEKVLATLMALLAGNEASRQQLQQGVGYDTLLSIVLRCSGPHGPSGGILMQLLHLVLEVGRYLPVHDRLNMTNS